MYRYKQNRQLSFLVKHDTKIVKVKAKKGIPVTKFKSQIILMKKTGLNVEHFRYHITINYDKETRKLEKMYLTIKKNAPNVFLN